MAGLLASAVLAVGLASNAAHAGDTRVERTPARAYVVRAGETLWLIAVRVGGPTADPRPLVDQIVADNHLAGPIFPGQTLLIPVP